MWAVWLERCVSSISPVDSVPVISPQRDRQIITSIKTPDSTGALGEITLGFDSLDKYATGNSCYFGAVCGRFANRIAGGTFELDGTTYTLAKNNGPNHLHGGIVGFDKVNPSMGTGLDLMGPLTSWPFDR